MPGGGSIPVPPPAAVPPGRGSVSSLRHSLEGLVLFPPSLVNRYEADSELGASESATGVGYARNLHRVSKPEYLSHPNRKIRPSKFHMANSKPKKIT